MDIPKVIGAYKITHPKTGLYYIGSATDLYERYHVHLSTLKSKTHANQRLQEAFNGDQNLTIEVITTETRDIAYDVEQKYLDRCVGKPNCCNVHNNARGGYLKGTMPPEVVLKVTYAAQEANRNRTYATGHKHTEESKERMRTSQRARDPASWPRGHKRSEETLAKMRQPRLKPRVKGRKLSEEHKAAVSAAAKLRCVKLKVTVVIDNVLHPSVSEAAVALGVTRRTIVNRIISTDKQFDGYRYG